jgi:hypothetical protein
LLFYLFIANTSDLLLFFLDCDFFSVPSVLSFE